MKKNPINQVEHHSRKERHYQGIASAPGILEGRIVIYMAVEQNIPLRTIDGREIASEMERFEKALLATQQELLEIKKHVFPALNAHEATLFDAHLLVLEDPALLKEVLELLHRERLNVEHVFDIVIKRFCESLNKKDSAYLRERILDIKDVSRRILNHLLGMLPNDFRLLLFCCGYIHLCTALDREVHHHQKTCNISRHCRFPEFPGYLQLYLPISP